MNQDSIVRDLVDQASEASRVFAEGSRLLSSLRSSCAGTSLEPELNKVMGDMIGLARAPERFYRETWDKIYANIIQDWEKAGESVFHFWDLVLHELGYFQEWTAILSKCGVTVPQSKELEAAAAESKRLREEAFRFWPWADPEEESVLKDPSRSVAVEDILRELQGSRH
jgi:hypothetical protein